MLCNKADFIQSLMVLLTCRMMKAEPVYISPEKFKLRAKCGYQTTNEH